MNPQLIIGLVLFIGGAILLVMGQVFGVLLVVIGGVLARMSSKDFIAKKLREQQELQAKAKKK